MFCDRAGIDLLPAMEAKLVRNAEKYPAPDGAEPEG
jgi:hypothetical protein